MKLLSILLTFLLTACSSISTPESHYYRLPEANAGDFSAKNIITKDLVISSVKVTGMLNSRNILYIEQSRPHEVIQFHYHLWHEQLSNAITNHFIGFLKKVSAKNKVTEYRFKSINGYHVQMTIKNMEIQYSASTASLYVKAVIVVNDSKGVTILDKTYDSQKSYQTKEIYQLVTNYNNALTEIYSSFVADLSQL